MEKVLKRSLRNKVISGVCGGLGEYFGLDPVLVRVIFIISIFALHAWTILLYIILWIVLPQDKTPALENSQEQKPKGNPSIAVSITLAVILILVGLAILFPDYLFNIAQYSYWFIALVLLFVAGKLSYDMIKTKSASIAKLSAVIITFTYGVFIILNQLDIIQSGIYFEYGKNLLAGILIIIGISLIFKNIQNKIPALIMTACVLLFVGFYSFANGNYKPFGFMNRMMENMRVPHFRRWVKNFGTIQSFNFSGTYTLPQNANILVYQIENSFGSLKIQGDSDNLLDYRGNGISPVISTNGIQNRFETKVNNEASETTIKINRLKPSEIELSVSAGNVDIELNENTKRLFIRNNLGNTTVKLPKNAKIRIKAESSIGPVEIPEEFKNVNGEYIYDGGSTKTLEIKAAIKMGNVDFEF